MADPPKFYSVIGHGSDGRGTQVGPTDPTESNSGPPRASAPTVVIEMTTAHSSSASRGIGGCHLPLKGKAKGRTTNGRPYDGRHAARGRL